MVSKTHRNIYTKKYKSNKAMKYALSILPDDEKLKFMKTRIKSKWEKYVAYQKKLKLEKAKK